MKKLIYIFIALVFVLSAGVSLADHTGDYYDNRDDDSAKINVSMHDGLTYMSSGFGAQMSVVPERVVIGNSSVNISDGRYRGSMPRIYHMRTQVGMDAAYSSYINNNAYWYPAHADYDDIDYYFTQSPTYNISQGSSGSETDELEKWFRALNAFNPDTKGFLVDNNLIAPTMQMISRRSRVASDAEYLTGTAHPNAFDDANNEAMMIDMATIMNPSEVPPMVQISVVEEDYNLENSVENFFEPEFISGENMSDTPVSITRIFHGREYTKRIVVTAEDSYDANDNPLTYHWEVLRGDPSQVVINPLNSDNSRVEILINYHAQTSIAGTNKLTNLVSVGAFVNNGHYYSAPAFVTSYTKRNEEREYDPTTGNLVSIDYNDNEIDYYISGTKSWQSDNFNYDTNGDLSGWTRLQDGQSHEFTKEGYLIESMATETTATSTFRVVYKTDPNTYETIWKTIGESFYYPIVECSWTYTDWSVCDGYAQIREVATTTPENCNLGEPILEQECESEDFPRCSEVLYSDWLNCVDGTATRTAMQIYPEGCVVASSSLEQSCESDGVPTCMDFVYTDWSDCTDDTQLREIAISYPEDCSGGDPVLSQECESVEVPICESWVFSAWSACENRLQNRSILYTSPVDCEEGGPILSQVCQSTEAPICESWTYGNWSDCNNDIQTRDIVNSYPGGCVDGLPVISQDCQIGGVNDLRITDTGYSFLEISWTSPTGNGASFDIRYSGSFITESNWAQATEVSGEPVYEAGATESYLMVGLFPEATYHIAMKVIDAYGNDSPLSNVVNSRTAINNSGIVDRIAPAVPSSVLVEPAYGQARMTWENPSDLDFVRVRIMKAYEQTMGQSVFSKSITVYDGYDEEFIDPFLNPETEYTYSIQSYDRSLNYSKYASVSVIPDEGELFINPEDYIGLSEAELALLSLASVSSSVVNRVSSYEATVIYNYNDFVNLASTEISLYEAIVALDEVLEENGDTYSIAYFIHEGTQTTLRLGAGERAGVLHSYFAAFNHLPKNVSDWQDVVKIASGRWPTERNVQVEDIVKMEVFPSIYLRGANVNNQNDLSAIMLMAYGLLPAERNTDSELAAINIYNDIFERDPVEASDWNIVRAIAYSGAIR